KYKSPLLALHQSTLFKRLRASHSATVQSISRLCCFNYVKKPIPQRNVRSFERTSARCSMQAIVFITHMNRQMCADPNAQWVQDRVKYLSQN
uniref:C-C motif chemokine n=1 Tax=Laticauda laticaudata TaxID=8630 RepID=A0A8C5SL30_LATLA